MRGELSSLNALPPDLDSLLLVPCFRRDERGQFLDGILRLHCGEQTEWTLYTGSTDDLATRVWQHKTKAFGGFTAKHDVDRLVWYEPHDSRESAFTRERQIKKWKRGWKLELIEAENPDWNDLTETLNH